MKEELKESSSPYTQAVITTIDLPRSLMPDQNLKVTAIKGLESIYEVLEEKNDIFLISIPSGAVLTIKCINEEPVYIMNATIDIEDGGVLILDNVRIHTDIVLGYGEVKTLNNGAFLHTSYESSLNMKTFDMACWNNEHYHYDFCKKNQLYPSSDVALEKWISSEDMTEKVEIVGEDGFEPV